MLKRVLKMVRYDEFVDSSDKLANLEDYYEDSQIYYIVNEGVWIITNSTSINYMNHAILHTNGEYMELIFHEKSWFNSDFMKKVPSWCEKISYRKSKKGIRVPVYFQSNFIEFLDKNQDWINNAASINYEIDM